MGAKIGWADIECCPGTESSIMVLSEVVNTLCGVLMYRHPNMLRNTWFKMSQQGIPP